MVKPVDELWRTHACEALAADWKNSNPLNTKISYDGTAQIEQSRSASRYFFI
jgi:hypothetical protein